MNEKEEFNNAEAVTLSSGEASTKGAPVANKPRRTSQGVSNKMGTSEPQNEDRFKTPLNEAKAKPFRGEIDGRFVGE